MYELLHKNSNASILLRDEVWLLSLQATSLIVHYATRAHFPLSYCSTLHFPYYVTLPYFSHNKTPPIFHITLHLASHNKSTHAISRLTSHTPSFPSLIVPPSPIRSLHAILRPICHTSHGIACIISLVRRHTPS
jgi:hypothetical protein